MEIGVEKVVMKVVKISNVIKMTENAPTDVKTHFMVNNALTNVIKIVKINYVIVIMANAYHVMITFGEIFVIKAVLRIVKTNYAIPKMDNV